MRMRIDRRQHSKKAVAANVCRHYAVCFAAIKRLIFLAAKQMERAQQLISFPKIQTRYYQMSERRSACCYAPRSRPRVSLSDCLGGCILLFCTLLLRM